MRFLRGAKGRLCAVVLLLASFAMIGFGGYVIWLYQQPKFHDVTLELGMQLPEVSAFLTEYANPSRAELVTAATEIDMSCAGSQTLTFQHGGKEEKVVLTLVDTTAPELKLRDITVPIDAELTPEDFVAESFDWSDMTVSFTSALIPPEDYGEKTVSIAATDIHGNTATEDCKVYYLWMRDAVTLELGDKLQKSDLLFSADKDAALIDQSDLDQINDSGVGTYTVFSESGNASCTCIVTVQDTTAPRMELKELSIYKGDSISADMFVVSASDISGEVTLRFLEEPQANTPGTQKVVIEAVDPSGNVFAADTNLEVKEDTQPPVFYGMTDISLGKYKTYHYTRGVSAYDERDGSVSFTYDASRVNTSKAGTYYVVYTATDQAGNTATYRREVTVQHDSADTAALVSSIAAGLSSDPEAIRDYVRDSIWYSYSWGGEDPVWYGFKNKNGNCYVHALCLQELLEAKGYTTNLIHVNDYDDSGRPTHYWLQIFLNGEWKHIDATPGNTHTVYSLMSDAQRYETLGGRDWDRDKWPACN